MTRHEAPADGGEAPGGGQDGLRERAILDTALSLFLRRGYTDTSLARVASELRKILLKVIDLLDDVDRDHNLVLLKGEHRRRIVKENIRIEDKGLFHIGSLHTGTITRHFQI